MKIVAIISEYNPFHTGHKYQIEKIREYFGEDCAIVAVMSGNFTQRGEIAFLNKNDRARLALSSGVNLVLEIPFPFSSSSAEFFAKSGVKIADAVGAEYLSFGSESGEIESLKKAAEIISSAEYNNLVKKLSENKGVGYPAICEMAYKELAKDSCISFTPNNILAVQYILAISSLKSSIKPHTIKRCGANYSDEKLESNHSHQSATALRGAISSGDTSALDFIPKEIADELLKLKNDGELPCDIEKISSAVISFFRLNPPKQNVNIHDAADGLYNRFYNASFKANDIQSLLLQSETKNYTQARVRRAMLNSFFGVTSSDVGELPHYTQILAMDKIGMQILKNCRKHENFQILTKPSDFKKLNSVQLKQKELSDKADSIFELTKPIPKYGMTSLLTTPFVKK